MIQSAKKEVFGHYLEFGLSDRLDIGYCDSTKCFQCSATLPGHEGSFKDHKNAFLNDPKSQKKTFLAIFWSLVCWIDLILHIMIVQNVSHHLGVVTSHAYVINYA